MATGDTFLNIYSKKLIGVGALSTKFFEYLKENTEDLAAVLYGEGVFAAVTIAGTVNDKFDLIGTDGEDGIGHHLVRSGASWSFENTNLQWYDVGFMYAETPDGTIETNTRTGEYEYVNVDEAVGDIGAPDSVTFPGPGLQFVVNTILNSENHVGRLAKVYLKGKAATDNPAVAFETIALTWNGSQNILATTGALGQSTPSLTAADYEILVEGPTVRQAASPGAALKGVSGVLYIGSVQGIGSPGTPTTFDTSLQTVFDVVADAAQVLYKDAHGFVKIRVTADASDSNEPQASVWDNSLNNVLTITDTRTWASKKIELENGTAITPGIEFNPGGGVLWEMHADDTGPPTVLQIGRNDADAGVRTVRMSNLGAGGAVGLQTEGNILVGLADVTPSPELIFKQVTTNDVSLKSGTGQILYVTSTDSLDWKMDLRNYGTGDFDFACEGEADVRSGEILSSSSVITLDDVNITSPISLSSTTFGTSLDTFEQSIIGGINEFTDMWSRTFGDSVKDSSSFGVVTTLASPPRVTIQGGTATVDGKNVYISGNTDVTCTASSTGWIVLDSSGALTFQTTADAAFTGRLALVYVETDATSVTFYQDVRKYAALAADDALEFTVGSMGQFADFEIAIYYLDVLSQATGVPAQAKRRYRLRMMGSVPTYTGTGIVVPTTLNHLEIIGNHLDITDPILWTGTGPYFQLQTGHVGFTLCNIVFGYSGATTGASYVVNADACSVQAVILDRVMVASLASAEGGTNGLLKATGGAALQFLTIKDCIVFGDLAIIDLSGSGVTFAHLEGNYLKKAHTTGTASTTVIPIDLGDGNGKHYLLYNRLTNVDGLGQWATGIKILNAKDIVIAYNSIDGEPGPLNYGIDVDGCSQIFIVGNTLENDITTNAYMTAGIRATSDGSKGGTYVVDNSIINGGNAAEGTAREAINVEGPATGEPPAWIVNNYVLKYRGTAATGIKLWGAGGGKGCRVIGNTLNEIGTTGILVQTQLQALVAENWVHYAGHDSQPSNAISESSSSQIQIIDNHIEAYDDDVDGILVQTIDAMIMGNYVKVYTNAASISIGISTTGGTASIVGNRVYGGKDGIQILTGSNHCIVSNNYCEDQAEDGMEIREEECSIGNNIIVTPGIYGIHLLDTADNCTVYGNIVKTPGTSGIRTDVNSDNHEIVCNQASTLDAGTGNDLAHNTTPP